MKEKHTKNKLILKAIEIKGECPVYKVGNKTVINGPRIDLESSDCVCIHALFSLGTFIVALRDGMDPKNLGLSKDKNDRAYFHCLDPGQPLTNGGTVIFEVTRIPAKK